MVWSSLSAKSLSLSSRWTWTKCRVCLLKLLVKHFRDRLQVWTSSLTQVTLVPVPACVCVVLPLSMVIRNLWLLSTDTSSRTMTSKSSTLTIWTKKSLLTCCRSTLKTSPASTSWRTLPQRLSGVRVVLMVWLKSKHAVVLMVRPRSTSAIVSLAHGSLLVWRCSMVTSIRWCFSRLTTIRTQLQVTRQTKWSNCRINLHTFLSMETITRTLTGLTR